MGAKISANEQIWPLKARPEKLPVIMSSHLHWCSSIVYSKACSKIWQPLQGYTNILFLFLSKIPPAAMAQRGTQTFYSEPHSSIVCLILQCLFYASIAVQKSGNLCRATQTFYFYFYPKSHQRRWPTEVHKHSIQNLAE